MSVRILSHNEFVQKVVNIVDDKYIFHSEYKGCYEPITIECKIDGYIWNVIPVNFLRNKCRCPKCSNCVQTKDTEYFKKEVYDLVGDEYCVLGEYIKAKEKILMLHNIKECQNTFFMTPDGFLHGARCPACACKTRKEKLSLTHEEFLKRVYNIHKDEYEILNTYNGRNNKVKVIHKKCKKEFEMPANSLLSGSGCRYCAGKMRKTQKQFVSEVYEIWKDEYSVLDKYINAKTKIKIRHNICGTVWDCYPDFLLRGHGCPVCKMSSGEIAIRNFLEYNNLNYQTQYKIEDCRNINPLPFDFALFDDFNNVVCLIEYDGIQHFKPVCFGEFDFEVATSNLNKIRMKDSIKTHYCNENNIKLVRIPYYKKDNIYNILKEKLSNILKKDIKIPNKYVIPVEKNETVNFIELLYSLPNGHYTKKWLVKQISNNSSFLLCKLYSKPVVKQLFQDIGVKICKDIIIIKNNYYDFDNYIEIIQKSKERVYIQNFLIELYKLPVGVHKKSTINKNMNRNRKVVDGRFFNDKIFCEFLKYFNIIISNIYITKI